MCYGAEELEGILYQFNAVEQGLVDLFGKDIYQQREQIDDHVHRGHAQTVAGTHGAEDAETEEKQELQHSDQQPNQRHVVKLLQQEHQKDGAYQTGDDRKQQSGYAVSQKPAFPAQGHGVQRVAHAALEQVAEKNVGAETSVDQIE